MKIVSFLFLLTLLCPSAQAKNQNQGQWIKPQNTETINTEKVGYFYYRKSFNVKRPPVFASLLVSATNTYNIWINGVPVVLDGRSYDENNTLVTDSIRIAHYFVKGQNSIAIKTRHLSLKEAPANESIFLQLFQQDSLNLVTDKNWKAGIDNSIDFHFMQESHILNYDATLDGFSEFEGIFYNESIRAKDLWLPVVLLEQPVNLQHSIRYIQKTKSQRIHHYTGIDMPVFLKTARVIDWDVTYKAPAYFGFNVESIGKKSIHVSLDTKEYGNIQLNYLTKEGSQEFYLDIPITIKHISIKLPVYLKIHSLLYKELQ